MFLVEQPFLWLLSLTMPRVGAARDHRHPRWKAALLPLTAPFTVAAAYGLLPAIGGSGLLYGAAAGLIGAGCLAAVYPRDDVPREPLKGAFAAATFALAVVWLNVAASALVGLAVAAGHILGLSPGLLGATVLSWGNSAPDLVGDVALARDGYPTMAVAACFASPLFSLLAGMGSALAYGASVHGGTLELPGGDKSLVLMYGALAAGLVAQLGIALLAPAVASWWRRRKKREQREQRGLVVVAADEEDDDDGGGEPRDADAGGHAVVRLGWPSSAAGLLTYTAYSVAYILFTMGLI
jgi:sodium/potassium/calcium exchanger 6